MLWLNVLVLIILIKYSEIQEELKEVKTELKSAQEDLIELGKEPASKGIKQTEVAIDLSKLTKEERLILALRQ